MIHIYILNKNRYLPISKLHSILAVANLLAHNSVTYGYVLMLLCANKLATAKIECSFEMGN